jgi:CAAX protease family protein
LRGRGGGVLWTREGRLRLGWRLLAFLVVVGGVTAGIDALLPGGLQATSFALLTGAVLAGAWMLAVDGRGPGALGFYLTPAGVREVGVGVGVGIGVAVTVVGAMALAGGARWAGQDGTLVGWFVGAVEALVLLALPAAAEEALLRGYPLQALAEAWGPAAALLVTSLAFGAMHLGNPGVTPLAVANVAAAGALLGAIYLRTGSLWWATGAHLGWNWTLGYLADLPVSGLEVLDAPLYEGVAAGPAWLSGGAFGPEGSALATVLVLLAAAAVWWGPWLTPTEGAVKHGALALPKSIGERDRQGLPEGV